MDNAMQCSQYDKSQNRCLSGHVPLNSICYGIASNITPSCMKEDRPIHLIKPNGLPLNWPGDEE